MIIELLGGIRATIFAALAGLLLMVAAIQHAEVRHCRASVVTLQSAAQTFESAQKTNLATIADLQAANRAWAARDAADMAAGKKAAQDAFDYAQAQQKAAQDALRALRHAYETRPTVKVWADTAVPADVVRVLTGPGQD